VEGLGLNLGYLLVQIIAFIVIYTLMSRFIYTPLVNVLRERRTRIAKGLEDATAAANARRNAEDDAAKIIADARVKANQAVEEARVRGEEVGKQVAAAAQADADKIREDARVAADQELNRRLADLRGQVGQIAVAMSQQLIGATLDEKRQQALISDFFAKVPQEALKMGGDVEVVSAMPLTDAEETRVKKETGAKNLTVTVDPNILGGLIVRSADRVVDASVRNSLGDLASRIR
jgi:F-type H+-transporting ATPase subunit b